MKIEKQSFKNSRRMRLLTYLKDVNENGNLKLAPLARITFHYSNNPTLLFSPTKVQKIVTIKSFYLFIIIY